LSRILHTSIRAELFLTPINPTKFQQKINFHTDVPSKWTQQSPEEPLSTSFLVTNGHRITLLFYPKAPKWVFSPPLIRKKDGILNRSMLTGKYLTYLIGLSIVSLLVATPSMGFQNALLGCSLGLLAFMLSYIIKFHPWKILEPEDKSLHYLIAIQIVIVVLSAWGWHSSINILLKATVHNDRVDSLTEHTIIYRTGQEINGDTYYSCHLEKYNQFVSCDEDYHKGDSVSYLLYIPRSHDTSFLLIHHHSTAIEGLLADRGFLLYGPLWYAFLLLGTWFAQLHRKGAEILVLKVRSMRGNVHKSEEFLPAWAYGGFFYIGYILYALFILAVFKNIYNLVQFKVLNIALVSLVFITILLTNWGEQLFVFSTNSILEVRQYRYVVWVRRIIKACGLILFGYLLIESLTHKDKSVVDLILEFLFRFFDIDVHSATH